MVAYVYYFSEHKLYGSISITMQHELSKLQVNPVNFFYVKTTNRFKWVVYQCYWSVYHRFYSENTVLDLFKFGLDKPVDFTGSTGLPVVNRY